MKMPHYKCNEFLFQDPSGRQKHLSSVQASGILKHLTRDLVTPWTLSFYRQATLAIAKRYISKLVEKKNYYYPANADDPIRMFAAGAGHHPRMLLTAYAIDKALPSRLQPELLEMYYRLSTTWQDWNTQYYRDNCQTPEREPYKSLDITSHACKRTSSLKSPERTPKRVKTAMDGEKLNDLSDGQRPSRYTHLNTIHRITGTSCKTLIERFSQHELRPFSQLCIPNQKVTQIRGLPIYKRFRCNVCPYTAGPSRFTTSSDKIRDHISSHKLGMTPMRAEQLQKFEYCYVQTFSSAKGRIKYFEVEPI
ncbi:scyllo-inositol 2-dehydrogenase (NADP(+)) IolU [Fusarium oxysporum f. sp. albedinis]|nr:scyllo-inositol 2-dehydrogenase (NADP(+)) IolU [Fusarium oxysporum f. sp. albedinis]